MTAKRVQRERDQIAFEHEISAKISMRNSSILPREMVVGVPRQSEMSVVIMLQIRTKYIFNIVY